MRKAEKILKKIRKFDRDRDVNELMIEYKALRLEGYIIDIYTTPKNTIMYIQVYIYEDSFKYYPDTGVIELNNTKSRFAVSRHLKRINNYIRLEEIRLKHKRKREELLKEMIEALY